MGNDYMKLTEKFLSQMMGVKAPLEAYIDGLEYAISELQALLEAAQADQEKMASIGGNQ